MCYKVRLPNPNPAQRMFWFRKAKKADMFRSVPNGANLRVIWDKIDRVIDRGMARRSDDLRVRSLAAGPEMQENLLQFVWKIELSGKLN